MSKKYECNFKKRYSLKERIEESSFIRNKHIDTIPIILEKHKKSNIGTIDKHKFLVPNTMTISHFLFNIKTKLYKSDSTSTQSLYLFVNGTLLTSTTTFAEIYENKKDEDGFLYIQYASEETFG